jgi:putative addiction module antidote
MIQKIIKVGSSAAVTIPKERLKEFNVKPGDQVYFDVDKTKSSFVYTPVKKLKATSRQKKVASITLRFIDRYKDDLNALKDK